MLEQCSKLEPFLGCFKRCCSLHRRRHLSHSGRDDSFHSVSRQTAQRFLRRRRRRRRHRQEAQLDVEVVHHLRSDRRCLRQAAEVDAGEACGGQGDDDQPLAEAHRARNQSQPASQPRR